jgi:hypothetical protein
MVIMCGAAVQFRRRGITITGRRRVTVRRLTGTEPVLSRH